MTSSKHYTEERLQKTKQTQRLFVLISAAGFFGMSLFTIAKVLNPTLPPRQEAPIAPLTSPLSTPKPQPTQSKAAQLKAELQAQEKGYESILKTEPSNQFALEALAKVRFQLNNASGATKLLETLVTLHPDRQDYKTALSRAKAKATSDQK